MIVIIFEKYLNFGSNSGALKIFQIKKIIRSEHNISRCMIWDNLLSSKKNYVKSRSSINYYKGKGVVVIGRTWEPFFFFNKTTLFMLIFFYF